MKMPFSDGLNMILKAFRNDLKDRYFQMYVLERLFMTEPIGFNQYFEQNTKVLKREDSKIVHEKVNSILKKALAKGGEKNGSI